ncbi:shikimate kinase [Halobacillus campisalis]|uniref:Shikimate kinase n=1 Tax=Halobacillus campisalis TaxID=435909 RepID=A0ABW2K400_9BACI|nr:shikimate kinase [Halobacillus campisalis]
MIFLIGYMGSGKSTVAKQLSESIGFGYIEMDGEIEKREGRSIPQIFEEDGEKKFRQLETSLLQSLSGQIIVSTGGGVILSEENQKLLTRSTVVFLDASFETINKRLADDEDRPLWGANIEENKRRYETRLPIYKELATLVVSVDDKNPSTIADEIVSRLKL